MRRDIGVHWHNKVEEKVEENKREDSKKEETGMGGKGRREGNAAGLGRVLVIREGI